MVGFEEETRDVCTNRRPLFPAAARACRLELCSAKCSPPQLPTRLRFLCVRSPPPGWLASPAGRVSLPGLGRHRRSRARLPLLNLSRACACVRARAGSGAVEGVVRVGGGVHVERGKAPRECSFRPSSLLFVAFSLSLSAARPTAREELATAAAPAAYWWLRRPAAWLAPCVRLCRVCGRAVSCRDFSTCRARGPTEKKR